VLRGQSVDLCDEALAIHQHATVADLGHDVLAVADQDDELQP